jgi:hypothetical protein
MEANTYPRVGGPQRLLFAVANVRRRKFLRNRGKQRVSPRRVDWRPGEIGCGLLLNCQTGVNAFAARRVLMLGNFPTVLQFVAACSARPKHPIQRADRSSGDDQGKNSGSPARAGRVAHCGGLPNAMSAPLTSIMIPRIAKM